MGSARHESVCPAASRGVGPSSGAVGGCSHHTVAGYVAAREAGVLSARPATRPQLIDEYLGKHEEWIDRSKGKVRADVAHDKLVALGYGGSERTSRRAVAAVKANYRLGRVRVHRPWVTEPGMWLQYDFGDGPSIGGVKTTLFCAWLASARFRVVLAIRNKTSANVMAALDVTLRRVGGAPTYLPHRQREDGDRGARGGDRGPQPGDGGLRPPLRGHDPHV